MTQDELKELLHYDPKTGFFTRLKTSGISKAGSVVGYPTERGWVRFKVKGKHHRAHRLAFLYMTGEVPEEVDHKNGIKTDNRWSNLRAATRSQNAANTPSKKNANTGYRGVVPWGKGFVATVSKDNKVHRSERFDNPEDAYKEYCRMSKELHGEFAWVK